MKKITIIALSLFAVGLSYHKIMPWVSEPSVAVVPPILEVPAVSSSNSIDIDGNKSVVSHSSVSPARTSANALTAPYPAISWAKNSFAILCKLFREIVWSAEESAKLLNKFGGKW